MTTITKTNFKNFLKILGFIENGSAFEKKFSAFNCSLGVDFANEKLIYPVEIKGRERNDDFKQPDSNTTKYKGTKAFKNLSDNKKTEQLGIRFYQYAKNIEFEKLFYFALTYMQSTVIISAPNEDKKQKEFLGYKWSGRKGSEGIKIIKRGGKMYVDEDRRASGTLASVVRNSFIDGELDLSEDNRLYAGIVTTSGMLDFSRVTFNKSIRTSIKAKNESG